MSWEERVKTRAYYLGLNGSTASDHENYLQAQKIESCLCTEFNMACQYRNVNQLKQALKNGADPTKYGNEPIQRACRQGYTEIVKVLLEDGRADPTFGDNEAIRNACYNNHIDVVRVLLQDGRADPASRNGFCIGFASRYGFLSVVKALLQDGRADPAADDNYALKWASKNGHTKVVEALLEDGRVDPTAEYEYAIRCAHTKKIKEMLNKYKYRVDGSEYQKLKTLIN